MAIISPRTLTQVRRIRTQVLTDVQSGFSPVAFVLWKRDRPNGTWDAGTAGEGWEMVALGDGMLRGNGQDGPVIGEEVIYQQAPYQLRTAVTTFDMVRAPKALESGVPQSNAAIAGLWIVIDGTRLFKVEGVIVGDDERPIANAYLTEVFDRTLPEVAP